MTDLEIILSLVQGQYLVSSRCTAIIEFEKCLHLRHRHNSFWNGRDGKGTQWHHFGQGDVSISLFGRRAQNSDRISWEVETIFSPPVPHAKNSGKGRQERSRSLTVLLTQDCLLLEVPSHEVPINCSSHCEWVLRYLLQNTTLTDNFSDNSISWGRESSEEGTLSMYPTVSTTATSWQT